MSVDSSCVNAYKKCIIKNKLWNSHGKQDVKEILIFVLYPDLIHYVM